MMKFVLPLVVASSLAACAPSEEPSEAETVPTSSVAQASVTPPGVPDPAHHTSLGGLCKYTRTWNGVHGRIYHAPHVPVCTVMGPPSGLDLQLHGTT